MDVNKYVIYIQDQKLIKFDYWNNKQNPMWTPNVLDKLLRKRGVLFTQWKDF